MIKTNSVEKGNLFEKKIYDLFQELLANDDLYINGKKSKIFWKKAYYSEIRKNNIIVDISIESYLKDADKYSLLTIIECKNYLKGVPVDDIEEFDSKLNQIGEHNTKGIIVTNSYFQESAFNIATSKKIGLVRINDKNEIDWVNYRKDRKREYFKLNIIKSYLCLDKLQDKNFIALLGQKSFDTIPNLFIELGIIDQYFNKSKYLLIPYFTEQQIEEKINNLPFDKLYKKDKLDIDDTCSILNSIYKVSFKFDNKLDCTNEILGKITFDPLEIHISENLKFDIYRWRFTFAHEIGHLILHYKRLADYLDAYADNEYSISFNQDYSIYFNKRLEIQANIFASRLLLPKEPLLRIVKDYFKQERIYKEYLYLDDQFCNINLVFNLLKGLQDYFGVSKEAAKYRLISEGLIKDATDNSIQGILKELI